jgi:ribosome recycling factor
MISIELVEGINSKLFEKDVEREMQEPFEHFEKEMTKVRTGRSHPSMVESLRVDCYGSTMAIKDLATISAPEAQLIVIHPWDKSVIDNIERAIALSDLSVTPLNDGELIRIQIPPMSSSRRDELIKSVGKKSEEGKVAIRTIRKDINNIIKDKEKAKKLSEDLSKRLQELLQKTTDKFIQKVDALKAKKDAEIHQL